MIDIDEHVFYEFSQSIQTALKELSEQISSIDKRILQFAASEEYKNALEWGKYGWAYIDEIPEDKTYYKKVSNEKEADELIIDYLTDNVIEQIKNRISSYLLKSYQKKIYDESIICFYEEKYRSCILLLFSIIDSLIISSQPVSGKDRDLAGKIAWKLNQAKELKHDSIFAYLIFSIDIKALLQIFGRGNDFVGPLPNIINRNWISHGMYPLEVSKEDCIKVLSLLYGICQLKFELNLLAFNKPVSEKEIVNGI